MVSFKEGFTRARKSTGLSRTEWADKHHYSVETVKKWETGKAVPCGNTLIVLCELFQCDMGYLFNQYDCKTRDLQFIHSYTGLSEGAISVLHEMFCDFVHGYYPLLLSKIIEDSNFKYFLSVLDDKTQIHENGSFSVCSGDSSIRFSLDSIANFELARLITDISDNAKKTLPQTPKDIKEKELRRLLVTMYHQGKLSDDEYNSTVKEFCSGNYNYSPCPLFSEWKDDFVSE